MDEKNQKSETYQKILYYARKEFLEHGFEKASMRKIAGSVNITAGALYRHFRDKEEIFETLVSPFLDQLKQIYQDVMTDTYDRLDHNRMQDYWEASIIRFQDIAGFIYNHYNSAKLLFLCARGTKYENLLQDFITLEVQETIIFLENLELKGLKANRVTEDELRLVVRIFLMSLFDVFLKNPSKENALKEIKTLTKFFYPGFRELLGF